MKVHQAEEELGLSDALAIARVTACVPVQMTGAPIKAPPLPSFPSLVKASASGQPDLRYLEAVLVSTGWNRNDDVFDREEVWGARRSPEDKPFNYEHTCDDIIGHITASRVVGPDGETVSDSTPFSDLPPSFHIVTPAVLYACWDKPELQERMDTLLEEIAKGGWFVSMECLFSDFDYAVKDLTTGKEKVVAREEKTAFLTRHLRAYGGDGTYQHFKLGRLLRKVVFSGKGLVRKPANPESVILGPPRTFAGSVENSDLFPNFPPFTGVSPLNKGEIMSEPASNPSTDKDLREALSAKDALLKERETALARTTSEKEELAKRNAEYSASLKDAAVAIETLGKEKVALAGERDALTKTLSEIQEKAKADERLRKAVEVIGDAEMAQKAVSTLASLSDEEFAAQLDVYKAVAMIGAAKTPPTQTNYPVATPPNPNGNLVKTVTSGNPTTGVGPAAVHVGTTVKASDLAAVEPNPGAALAVPSDDGVQALGKAMAEWLNSRTKA